MSEEVRADSPQHKVASGIKSAQGWGEYRCRVRAAYDDTATKKGLWQPIPDHVSRCLPLFFPLHARDTRDS